MRSSLRVLSMCVAMAMAGPLAAQQLVLSRVSGTLYTVNTSTGVATAISGTSGVQAQALGSQNGGEVVGYMAGGTSSGEPGDRGNQPA